MTPIGKIQDVYGDQYQINNNWYAKKILLNMGKK